MTLQSKHILVAILLVGLGGFFYFKHTRYYDPAAGCSIKIRPSLLEWNSGNIRDALSALKYGYPEKYKLVCANITEIKTDMACGGWEGGCYYGDKGEIFVSTANQEFLGWTAAVIAHETCHDRQNKEGRPYSEDECYAVGHKTMQTLVRYR